MGVITCGRHGKTAIVFVCEHVDADALARRPLAPHTSYRVDLDGEATGSHDLCDTCRDRAALAPDGGVISTEEWDVRDLPTVPVCARCRDEPAFVAE